MSRALTTKGGVPIMRTLYAITALFLGAMPTLAAAEDAAPAWSLHGFGEVSVKNDYVTPRGLVVTTAGATVSSRVPENR